MSKQIIFESAHAAALELRPAVGGLAVYLKFIAKMSRGAARSMDAEYAVFGTDSLPKPGWTKMDSDFIARNVGLTFEVKSIGKSPKAFHLELNCPLVDKFVFVRIGGKKKGKGTYVACKARALVDGRYQDLVEFLLAAGAADGVLTLKPREEQQPLQAVLEHADGTAKSNDEIFGLPKQDGQFDEMGKLESSPSNEAEKPEEADPSEIRIAYDEELKNPNWYARVRVVLLEGGYLASWWVRLGPAKKPLLSESGETHNFPTAMEASSDGLGCVSHRARLVLAEPATESEGKTPCARVVAWVNEKLAAVEVLAKA
jgi:hypothetical protein